MTEWLVVETTEREIRRGYIPREIAEQLLGRDLGGTVSFTESESERLHAHPAWRDTEPK